MFRKTALCALALSTALFSLDSSAGFLNGNKLKGYLDAHERIMSGRGSGSDSNEAQFGMGYVSGVQDAMDGILICTPSSFTVGQGVAMVKKYLNENPDKWTQPAEGLILQAIQGSFPCKR